jgi:large subunit ribosomal protein L22
MESRAIARSVRIGPRKVRLVADLVRGKKVEEALNLLEFTNKRASKLISDLIRSAVANVDSQGQVDIDTLVVKKIFVDGGITMKRFLPMPMGRAGKIRKRTSHITIVLDES